MDWKPGDRLTHRFNPELGTGLVAEIDGRSVVVSFPETGSALRLAHNSDALVPIELRVGSRARLLDNGDEVQVAAVNDDGTFTLEDGRVFEEHDLWPIEHGIPLFERLADGDLDSLDSFALRLEALHLAAIREADGLGSFLGGRIRLFPHQLYCAEQATRTDPVRWLLADEVGLGKTVEACLILNHLLRTGRAERTLVVTPSTLSVQWLGELWRKYHQVFVLIDDKRLQDVEKVYGEGFNPFDAYHQSVVSIEMLIENPWLTQRAVDAGIDLLIIDEAHHLQRPKGHPGNAEYRAVAPICGLGRHLLLLSATPLEDDAHGFFRLLQLLRPEEFPDDASLERRIEAKQPLPPCTSATRRADIGGLPPREGHRIDIDPEAWAPIAALEAAMRDLPAEHQVAARQKARKVRRALASGPSLEAILDPKDAAHRKLARQAGSDDPRLEWLIEQAQGWRVDGDKTLVFVAQRETLEWLRTELGRRVQLRTGMFHEDLSAGQRDIEVAQFRSGAGPSMLISTECGGEGRNFEFCRRIVLFDLPWNPIVVEQRIGRLDRIGRDRPVEIVYFHPGRGLGAAVADLYEQLGLFERPLGSFERELAAVEGAIEELALSDQALDDASHFRSILDNAERAYTRVQEAAYAELHRAPFRGEMGPAILARVPEELDELTQDVVVGIAEQLGLHVEEHREGLRHSVEFGRRAKIESLPGVPGTSSFLGSFDRAEAVADEAIDFFASGHPLVEGVLIHQDEAPNGRVALLHQKSADGAEGFGVLAIYKQGPQFEAVALDLQGNERPDWAEQLTGRPVRSRRVHKEEWTGQPGWAALIRSLAQRLELRGRPVAVAAFRFSK